MGESFFIVYYDRRQNNMSEFYEPTLFMSTPEHPNTMGVMLKAHRAGGR